MTWNTLTGARGSGSFRRHVPASDVRFASRIPVLVEWITGADPDVFGLQENEPMGPPWHRPVNGLLPRLPHLRAVHPGTDAPILYRPSRFTLKDSGVSTISTAHFHRVCTWVILASKRSGTDFLVANTHLDSGENPRMNRIRRASLVGLARVVEKVNPDATLPLVLLGDFNTITHRRTGEGLPHVFEPLTWLNLVNSWTITAQDSTAVPGAATMNSFGTEVDRRWTYRALRHDGFTLDYVWCGPGITVRDWRVITGPKLREIDGFPFFAAEPIPSDHCPILAQISLPLS
jgi:endonuclease/exonuclease/phosphatase family metal-dependent hydrolase